MIEAGKFYKPTPIIQDLFDGEINMEYSQFIKKLKYILLNTPIFSKNVMQGVKADSIKLL